MAVYNGGHSCQKRGAQYEPERDETTVAFVALLHERTETDEKWEVRYEVEMLRRWTYVLSLHLYQVLYRTHRVC